MLRYNFTLSLFFLCSSLWGQVEWTRDTLNPVISGIDSTILDLADPSVIYDPNSGTFRMWCGCVGEDPTFASICYSESVNGSSWDDPSIVFSPSEESGAWDNQKAEVPTVILDDLETDPSKRYKMWYGGSNNLKPDSTIMGYAYSSDGLTWTRLPAAASPYGKEGLVLIPGFEIGDAAVVSDPTVIKSGSMYHVWYNSFGAVNDILISHATSTDGINWTKDAANPVLQPDQVWEEGGPGVIAADVSQPTVHLDPATGEFVMSYGSFEDSDFEVYDGFGYARSTDGSFWVKDTTNPFFTDQNSSPGEEIGIHANNILFVQGTYHMFYGGVNDQARRKILHATSEENIPTSVYKNHIQEIRAYPNPMSEKLVVEIGNFNFGALKICLYDLTGRIVRMTETSSLYKEISGKGLLKGMYILQVYSENGDLNYSNKIVVK